MHVMTTAHCLFSGAPADRWYLPDRRLHFFEGSACGLYAFDSYDLDHLDLSNQPGQARVNCARYSLEHSSSQARRCILWVPREPNQRQDPFRERVFTLIPTVIGDLLEERIDHSEKPLILLEALAERLADQGAFDGIQLTHRDRVWARIPDPNELRHLLHHLHGKDWIRRGELEVKRRTESASSSPIDANDPWAEVFEKPVGLTVDGWARIRERVRALHSRRVVIATQFQWPDDEEEARIAALGAIERACRDCGYEASIVQQHHTDSITDRIIADIKRARFVVAELSYNNRGVYYEAGFARGLGIPVIHVVREGHVAGEDCQGKKLHFDIAQIPYIEWKDPAQLQQALQDRIEASIGRYGAAGR